MTTRIKADRLLTFCTHIFMALGLTEQGAAIAAETLVTTDLRGIDSHGIAHLWRYSQGLQKEQMQARPDIRVQHETPSTALVDGDLGFGPLVAHRCMEIAIAKARAAGSGWVVAQRSTHFGAAGHWASMAVRQRMIGFCLTASSAHVSPTFGARPMFGTNPIAIAVPANQEPPFLLDMSTSVVPVGRLEVYSRQGKVLPEGWVIDLEGKPITDAHVAMESHAKREASLLPLGGSGEIHSGYKGYGLGLAVEIMANLLAGYDREALWNRDKECEMGQFFGALSVDAFRPFTEFTRAMDNRMRDFKTSPALPGAERVLVAGQKEFEITQDRLENGIPIDEKVLEELRILSRQYEIPL